MADYTVEIFYDGECPLCSREVGMLRRLDRKQRIRLTDIAAPEFDPGTVGRTQDELMASIHGRLRSGQLIEGVEVFRQAYAALGLGPLIALTRLPVLKQGLDAAYQLFARNRLRLTGRCSEGQCEIERSSAPGTWPA